MIEGFFQLLAPVIAVMSLISFLIWPIFVVALIFAMLWHAKRRPAVLIAAVLWSAYAVYETLMYKRILCSGDCNIRIDLLVIYPLLLVVSIVALISVIRPMLRRPPSSGPTG